MLPLPRPSTRSLLKGLFAWSVLGKFIWTVSLAVLASFIAAALFYGCLTQQRPEFAISPEIARNPPENGKIVYMIKAVNRSDGFVKDVIAELHLVGTRVVPGGETHRNLRKLEITNSPVIALEGAFRFRIEEDLEAIWKDEETTFLRFTLVATDPLSGTTQVFTKLYHRKRSEIKDGQFVAGDSLEIK